jgi:hypothetical protein
MIYRALRLNTLTRQSSFRFADNKEDEPFNPDDTNLEADVKSQLRKKFTGEIKSKLVAT